MMKSYEKMTNNNVNLIKAVDSNGKVWFFPPSDENKDYIEYLAYTSWIEAGNDGEEFWTQGKINDSEASE